MASKSSEAGTFHQKQQRFFYEIQCQARSLRQLSEAPDNAKRVRISFDDDQIDIRDTRYATDPPNRLAPLSASMSRRVESGIHSDGLQLSTSMEQNTSVRKRWIPGAQEGNIAVYLGDGIIYTADHKALQSTSAFFHDKLAYLEQDLGGADELTEIGACFRLPARGKPILQRVSKTDLIEAFKAFKDDESSATGSRVSSDSTTIKQEPGSHPQCPPDTPSPIIKRDKVPKRVAIDAHITLLQLMHMRSPTKLEEGFDHTLQVAKRAADLAQPSIYDCVEILRPRLAASLHQYRQDLFLAIKDDPPRMAMLACGLEDESILKDAIIHMVGCYPYWPEEWTPQDRLDRRPECQGLLVTVDAKAKELRRKRELLDRELLLNTLTIGDDCELDLTKNPETWMTTQFYRDAIANMLNELRVQNDENCHIPHSMHVGNVYRQIHRGSDAWLPAREVFKKFEKLGMGYDHAEILNDLTTLKEYASRTVKQICHNELMLDVSVHDVGYLTCVELVEEDLPWIARKKAELVMKRDGVGFEGPDVYGHGFDGSSA